MSSVFFRYLRRALATGLVFVTLASLSTIRLAAQDAVAIAPGQQAPVAGSLAALVAELEQHNPDLLAARSDVAMRAARVAPAGQLPDPALSIGSMTGLSRPPFFPAGSTVNAFRQISVSQELPFFGKRDLRRAVATTDMEAAQWEVEVRRRQLIADLKIACLEYDLAQRRLAILIDSRALATQLRQVAEARLSVGQGQQQDVIKAQLELSMVRERQVQLEQQQRQWTTRINALLLRAPDAPGPEGLTIVVEPAPESLQGLRARAEEASAVLQRDAAVIARGETAVRLASREVKPDVRVGLTAQKYVAGMPWMYGVDLMVTLPIHRQGKQRPQIAEAASALASSHSMKAAAEAATMAQVDDAYWAIAAADQLLALYGDSILPQARIALESSLNAYQVGGVEFMSVLQSAQALVAAELSRVEQQTRRAEALVALEPLLGQIFVK